MWALINHLDHRNKSAMETQGNIQETLTPRQFEILELWVWSRSRKKTATTLGISTKTVDNTIAKICELLEIQPKDLVQTYMEKQLHACRPAKLVDDKELARRIKAGMGALMLIISIMMQATTGATHEMIRTQGGRTASRTTARVSRGQGRDGELGLIIT